MNPRHYKNTSLTLSTTKCFVPACILCHCASQGPTTLQGHIQQPTLPMPHQCPHTRDNNHQITQQLFHPALLLLTVMNHAPCLLFTHASLAQLDHPPDQPLSTCCIPSLHFQFALKTLHPRCRATQPMSHCYGIIPIPAHATTSPTLQSYPQFCHHQCLHTPASVRAIASSITCSAGKHDLSPLIYPPILYHEHTDPILDHSSSLFVCDFFLEVWVFMFPSCGSVT